MKKKLLNKQFFQNYAFESIKIAKKEKYSYLCSQKGDNYG